MEERQLREAVEARKVIRVHLISGETYEGLCELDKKPNYLIMKTDKGEITFPIWAVKRAQQLCDLP
ncbi:hypothetical protein KIH86_27400 [Paenibacillus sp. HN-1]|uniref:hypothetical protein n=1 Tax=Paenibacillus TaxID=44249 RepID=UPI001CA9C9E1|nr:MULTISPECIES: hypothetical protein [Paenibacillus]MBY9078431.1 hypothetical protein [Paenibacillus sp. CGMCC 1.18879]MBY9087921.1 hypothetical protein [Paenibacillus sinensis]